ncbi:hypothetical protein QBC37DRAFT_424222 [Rhypophila decipiens]|uniref:Uncharacterized protein n=1 Tax=Rhypophila decipiens TaxID=261697 RepID=A0AAN6Y5D7_9PEZI|nr:hypothetical protein QBC37DRAFT_424222 [Rhypophila decipiens]
MKFPCYHFCLFLGSRIGAGEGMVSGELWMSGTREQQVVNWKSPWQELFSLSRSAGHHHLAHCLFMRFDQALLSFFFFWCFFFTSLFFSLAFLSVPFFSIIQNHAMTGRAQYALERSSVPIAHSFDIASLFLADKSFYSLHSPLPPIWECIAGLGMETLAWKGAENEDWGLTSRPFVFSVFLLAGEGWMGKRMGFSFLNIQAA